MKNLAKLFIIGLAIFITPIAVISQAPTGSLTGTVSSTDGVLPSAIVEIKFDLTGRTQTGTTNSGGVFAP